MSDERLRELQRRWQETGAVEDGAALLRARLRAGTLTPERLALLAHLGEPAASLALGDDAPEPIASASAWLSGLDRFGREAHLRAAVAVAARLRPLFERANPRDRRYQAALEAIWDWLRAPEPATRRAAVQAADALPDASPISNPANCAARALRNAGLGLGPNGAARLGDSLRFSVLALGPGAAREVAEEALLEWALETLPDGESPAG